ncbi:MAG TPA: haloacid dehalogenase-like hydrolase [Baekduia sp.]|uniref:HAD family hydrolase n=1 Tax=Baekduia sp. TaxID=2600305 RepID=UPI002BE68071|nr:haloacid dehalogenase-like hydrolase [Baekduia sp.]HMJ35546.1 haloacid dehalogenase-like hydrolase [Baekduia sp.]
MLLLFDIDGTLLLKASRDHAAALHAALKRVHGIDIPAGKVEAAGRTDLAIARTILTLAGVPAERIDDRVGDVRAVTCVEYARRCPADFSDHLAPQVAKVLDALDARDGLQLALVTGNLEPVARLKVDRAGIGHHFPKGQGAYGSDDEDRAALPALARARAGTLDEPYSRERTVVIGDTPRDIACARADGVHVIAVATGPYKPSELRGADAVCAHMGEVPAALAALDARPGLGAA